MQTKKLLQIISRLSLQYRTKLVSFGFSESECNQALLQLGTESRQNLIQMNVRQKQEQSKRELIGKQRNNKVFEKVLVEELGKRNGQIMRYLQDLVGKLEIGLVELEEWDEQNNKNKIVPIEIQYIHGREEESSKSIQVNSLEEPNSQGDKKSNFGSTQADSLLNHESQIESSLQNLIFKTKILKAMLQKQMLSVQALNMGTRQYYPLSASGSFMA